MWMIIAKRDTNVFGAREIRVSTQGMNQNERSAINVVSIQIIQNEGWGRSPVLQNCGKVFKNHTKVFELSLALSQVLGVDKEVLQEKSVNALYLCIGVVPGIFHNNSLVVLL